MRLFLDFETSGLWRDDLPAISESQPWPVQIALRLYNSRWDLVGSLSSFIKPDSRSIQPEAQAIHGITEARCLAAGISLQTAMVLLHDYVDASMEIVAHHMEFERHVVAASLFHAGSNGLWWARRAKSFACTMERTKNLIGIPGQFDDFKFPTLDEAHAFCYPDAEYHTTHNADADVDACVRVCRALVDRGLWKP